MERKSPVKKHKRFDPRLNKKVDVGSYSRKKKPSHQYKNIHSVNNNKRSISLHQEKMQEIIRMMNSLKGMKWTDDQRVHLNKAYNELYAILNQDYDIYSVE